MAAKEMPSKQTKPIVAKDLTGSELRDELAQARLALREAEAELAEEQALVNAFRMHCRLKLDSWINRLLELQRKRQSLITRLELIKQSEGLGAEHDPEDSFWPEEDKLEEQAQFDDSELILPTDVPRDKAAEKRLYRQLARRFHPDLGVTAIEIAYRTEMMAAVNTAYRSGDIKTMYDLADRLDPDEKARLASIPSVEIRELRRQIIRCQLRTRRARRHLAALREENTARLWRKAQRLDREDTHWWEVVREEIETTILRLQKEVDILQELIDSRAMAPLEEE